MWYQHGNAWHEFTSQNTLTQTKHLHVSFTRIAGSWISTSKHGTTVRAFICTSESIFCSTAFFDSMSFGSLLHLRLSLPLRCCMFLLHTTRGLLEELVREGWLKVNSMKAYFSPPPPLSFFLSLSINFSIYSTLARSALGLSLQWTSACQVKRKYAQMPDLLSCKCGPNMHRPPRLSICAQNLCVLVVWFTEAAVNHAIGSWGSLPEASGTWWN